MMITLRSETQWLLRRCTHIDASGQWPVDLIVEQLAMLGNTSPWTLQTETTADSTAACMGVTVPTLQATYIFKHFNEMEPFIGEVMRIARDQDHHPEVQFGFKTCTIRLSTHSAGGISDNDWIVACLLNAQWTRLQAMVPEQ